MTPCKGCNKPVDDQLNFCEFSCHVDYVKRNGGILKTPNGLPVMCLKHDIFMLECEHGDHPTYKFPVTVEYIGTDQNWDEKEQIHALIYTDYNVALTIYETNYYLWFMIDGRCSVAKYWQLSEASRIKILGEKS